MAASGSAELTEANLEARDFRLDFAQATLQSFKRDRSRSPLRVAPLPDAARRALDVVCKRDIAARVQSQQATIVRLHQELAAKDAEIASLRAGNGPIGPVLIATRAFPISDERRADLMAKTESVAHFINRVHALAHCVQDELFVGEHYASFAGPSPRQGRTSAGCLPAIRRQTGAASAAAAAAGLGRPSPTEAAMAADILRGAGAAGPGAGAA